MDVLFGYVVFWNVEFGHYDVVAYLKEVDVGPVEVWAGCRYFIVEMHFCYNEAV